MSDKKNEITGVGLYTPEQKLRRDQTVWTLVQGVLAPLQFLVFAISAVFVVNFLLNGTGLFAATVSVVIKTGILYTIMVTGAIWEKVVFGRYLFAPAFFLGRRGEYGCYCAPYALSGHAVGRLGYTSGANVDRACSLCGLCRQRRAVSQEIPACKSDFGRDDNVIRNR